MGSSAFRSSQRLTITVAQSTLETLVARSSHEGRSISNLAAYLLERSLERHGGAGLFESPRPAAR